MTINTTTGVISWTLTAAQIGTHDVTVRVQDAAAAAEDTQSFTITVAADKGGVPTITSVSGDVTTITGTSFGTGGATNITWDNFEDGVDTNATVGAWGTVNVMGDSSESCPFGKAAFFRHHS